MREASDETVWTKAGDSPARDSEPAELPVSVAPASDPRVPERTRRTSPATRWWVVLLIGIGLGAALFALSHLRRSAHPVSEARAVRAARAADPQPPPASALTAVSGPSAIETEQNAQLSAPLQSLDLPGVDRPIEAVSPQPSAATPSAVTPSAAARLDSQPTVHASAALRSAAPAPARAEPVIATTATPTAAPARDSEEGRLAAAAIRTGRDTPLDAVIDTAFSQAQDLAEQRRAAAAAIPLVPSRDAVIKTMVALLPALRDCAQGQAGLATANVVVSNDGSVQMVGLIGQAFGGTPAGRCMETVVRGAHFPHFQRPSLRMQFPFSLP